MAPHPTGGDDYFVGVIPIHMIPIESVEKAILAESEADGSFPFSTDRDNFSGPKDFHNYLQQMGIATQKQIFEYLMTRNDAALQEIVGVLRNFLHVQPDIAEGTA